MSEVNYLEMDCTLGIPNVFYDKVMPEIKTLGEIKLITYVILNTITLGKDEVPITQDTFEKALNFSSTTVCKAIQDSLEHGFLLRRYQEGIYYYRTKLPGMPFFDLTPYLASYPGEVYILQGDKYFKIGKSRDLEKRLRLFNLTLPFKVELIHRIYTNDCSYLESYFHKLFASKRVNGEWFLLEPEDIEFLKGFEVN